MEVGGEGGEEAEGEVEEAGGPVHEEGGDLSCRKHYNPQLAEEEEEAYLSGGGLQGEQDSAEEPEAEGDDDGLETKGQDARWGLFQGELQCLRFPLTQHGEEDPLSGLLIPIERMHFLDGGAIQFEDDISDVKTCFGGGAIHIFHLIGDPGTFEAIIRSGPGILKGHYQQGQGDQREIERSPIKPGPDHELNLKEERFWSHHPAP